VARSGSVDYTVDRDTLIQMAFELIKVGVEGETLSSDDITIATRALNIMIKAYHVHGLQLWKRASVTVPLTAATAAYTIGRSGTPTVTADRPLRILEAYRIDSNSNQVPLTPITLQEYYALPNLAQVGIPVQYAFNPTLDNSTVYLWPVPATADATEYDVKLIVQSPLNDMDSSTDNFDFPEEWLEALYYSLAVRLAPRYGLPVQERSMLRAEAKEHLEAALSFDIEQGSVYFQESNE
jgi:hypothetical protein